MDAETLHRLYETNYMRVYSYVMTLTRDSDSAEEITQETFYKAFTTTQSFGGESNEYTWLCAIAKNVFYDDTRKRKKMSDELPDENTDSGVNIQQKVADADSSFRIHLVLHELSEPYREVFELRVFGELSFAQIGTIFSKTENWARVTYHRAKLKIQERMEEI